MIWKDEAWLCIDVETTGLSPKTDRIVSVAVGKRLPGERRIKLREWLVDPGIPIPPEATEIHGITDAMVRGKPPLEQLSAELLGIVEKAPVLVGYMWPFDDSFLLAGLDCAWLDAIESKPVIDALVVVRLDDVGRYWKGKGRHKLMAACEHLGVVLPDKLRAHKPGADCWAALALLEKLQGYLSDDADEAARMIVRERAEQDQRFQEWLAKQPPLKAEGDAVVAGENLQGPVKG